ncbi:hypothetical protein JOE57_001441 [Microlunatus panaciterrae]|uniref:DUF4352 domain-containing protein n=1 Tax=Microlunatus panaciterrae TaxID=400768 RepID=A0ABS2RHN6_9ACTN|nr:hypothetical protein [Microlunatus panaciterrae]MBM7798520.1 hypothetical protein [Microlunatus panaciterrae]
MSTVPPGKPAPTRRAPLGKTGDLGNGVTVTVSKVESVKGQAHGPGEIAGPALRISITVDNKTKKAVPMELALVNLYYGSDRTPAGPLSGPGADPLSKPVAAGKASTGTYVFAVPKDQRGAIEVEFTYTTAAPKVVFRGAV